MTATGRLRPSATERELAGATVDAVLGARVHVDVMIPRTQIAGRMRLVDRAESFAITAGARAFFAEHQLPIDPTALSAPGVLNEWNCEVATRHLAIAVREPNNEKQPLASIEEWRLCDDEQISSLWQEYQDLRERLDPLAKPERLTEQQYAAIRSAVKKKELDLLRSYGASTLASFLLTSDEQPAS